MRKVHITYEDGHTVTYKTIRDAAADIRCDPESVRRMVFGRNNRLKAILRITDIRLDENRHQELRGRPNSNRVPVRCISESGEVIECETIQEARRRTGPEHYIAPFIDDGDYHWGWKYESLDKPSRFNFAGPVNDDDIARIYRYSRHYLARSGWWLTDEDREEIVQESAARVASDISCGKIDQGKFDNRDVWLYCEVRSRCYSEMDKYFTYYKHKVEEPADYDGDCEWIDAIGGGGDDDWRDAAERLMYEEMPEDLREIAKLVDEGRKRLEITIMLGITDAERIELMRRLGEWLMRRHRDEETGSDSDEEGA